MTKVNQWEDTSSLIKCFNKFENKKQSSFMVSDIETFYPSINQNLFIKPTQFPRQINENTDRDINLIMQAGKSLLFNG